MTTWNHRLFRRRITMPSGKRQTFYDVREVYYDAKRQEDGMTANAITPGGETVEELREELVMMLRATYHPLVRVSDCDSKLRARIARMKARKS